MSADLINRDMVINAVARNCRLKTENGEEYGFIDILSDIVDFPTAYDAGKVVEHLKELKTYKLNMADAMSEIMRRGELGTYVCLEDVLEIIKSGGVLNGKEV